MMANRAARPGGLVRAYTDSVTQALLQVEKTAIVRQRTLRCTVPYSMEGMLWRELDGAGATLLNVEHGDAVLFDFSLPETAATALLAHLHEAGNGRIVWLDAED